MRLPSRVLTRTSVLTAAATLAVATAGAGVTYAHAHKSVSLDVNGQISSRSTFAGSVAEVLADAGVDVGPRDLVAPDPSSGLSDGTEIVVRTAHPITVDVDGRMTVVWSTALDAQQALAGLDARGDDVRLVASRSVSAGRAALPIDLGSGPVDVVADGATVTVPDATGGVDAVLARAGVTLGPDDRVGVRRAGAADATLSVVVTRVEVRDETTTTPIPFATETRQDATAYTGARTVVAAGAPGVQTRVERVTYVDGTATDRTLVSDAITQQPVTQVEAVGTKARPAPAPATSSAGSTYAGDGSAGGGVDALNWAALARCESGGNPTIVSSNGLYHGLYQFTAGTWRSVGGSGVASQASADEQTYRAKLLYQRSGAGPWPVCGKRLFG